MNNIPDSVDAAQVLRLRRCGLGALAYALCMALLAVAWTFGVIPGSAALEVGVAFLAINLALYAAFRSGFNLRFHDPSLTLFQILTAITVQMYLVYNLDDGRDIALFGCFVVFQFGIFRLKDREFVLVTLYTLAAYALVLNLLMHLRPAAIQDVQREWMSWLMLAGFLPVFTLVGTEINALRRRLRDSARQLQVFADNIPAMTASWDENLCCRFASKAYTTFLGIAAEDLIGKHMREILGEEGYREVEGHFSRVLQGDAVTYHTTRRLRNGETRYLQVRLLPHVGEHGKVRGCFGVTTDITEHKLAEERIQNVAHHDSLTGLPNRLLFNDRLGQAISVAKRDSRQFALLFLDLDRFKPVNDALGHAAGDQLLKEVGARIRQQVRESDTLARVGGDEFIVILPAIAGREEAEAVARKISTAIAAPFWLGSPEVSIDIGTSIGIAVYPTDGVSPDVLVKAADAAMYRAKQAGGDLPMAA